jgi:uncharacterized membrane protein YidH (DUF202 family)
MTLPDDREDLDPGLARERTELAWTRTASAFAALGGAMLKTNPAAGLPALATSALIWELGRRARRTAGARAGSGRLLLITAAVVAVSLVALATVLSSGGGPFGHR